MQTRQVRTIAKTPDDTGWSQGGLKKYRTNAKSATSCSAMNAVNQMIAAGCLVRYSYERKFNVESLTRRPFLRNGEEMVLQSESAEVAS